jgi:hypothetical protein
MKRRKNVTREDLLWETDKKTAALKKIHKLCNELLDDDDCSIVEHIKAIRYLAGTYYLALEPQVEDHLEIKAQ